MAGGGQASGCLPPARWMCGCVDVSALTDGVLSS